MPRASARASASNAERPRLVIVGAGMTAQRFCERLVSLGQAERYLVTVIGEEPARPYDRIRLGQVVRGRPSEHLRLCDDAWYANQGIDLRVGVRVVAIDRDAGFVRTGSGERIPYDRLVLATGSSPRVPSPFEVRDERVHVYRTAADAEAIGAAVRILPHGARALVVGGGVLGLELARDLKSLGARVEVVEAASHLLARQLELKGAARVKAALERLGIGVRLAVRTVALRPEPDSIVLATQDGDELRADLVVVAVGVRPNDELARSAGLPCHPRGGVKVDRSMSTIDPKIDAIGECAVSDGEQVGLVGPCFDMAEALAARLAGARSPFRPAMPVTKLKLDVLEATTVGAGLVDEPGYTTLEHESPEAYRRLVFADGRLVGMTSVGPWDELHEAIDRVLRRERIGSRNRRRFAEGRALWASQDPVTWRDDVPLCTCTGTTCGAIRAAIADGCSSAATIAERTGAGTVCGSCQPRIARLVGAPLVAARVTAGRSLLVFGAVALALLPLFLLTGPFRWATSVDGLSVDVIWRDPLLRQVSGFSLAGVCFASLVLSLGKRVRFFRRRGIAPYRVVHVALGTLALVGVALHTGYRLGANLDRALMFSVLGLAALGGVAAIATALEPKLPPRLGGQLRRATTLAHLLLFWPFPVLLVLHVLKTFYF